MDFVTLLGIAFSLAMDAFAVSLGVSISLKTLSKRHYFRLAFHFGLFQFLMPILGWFIGQYAGGFLSSVGPPVAAGILFFLGFNMIRNARKEKTDDHTTLDPTRGFSLIFLSVATSIDAFAVGLSIGLLGEGILLACAVIGIVACLLTCVGMRFGSMLGYKIGDWAEVIGGVVLILLAVKVIAESV